MVCGSSHFYVQELSDRLKQKSIKDKTKKKKMNEYEKEYAVSSSMAGLICSSIELWVGSKHVVIYWNIKYTYTIHILS